MKLNNSKISMVLWCSTLQLKYWLLQSLMFLHYNCLCTCMSIVLAFHTLQWLSSQQHTRGSTHLFWWIAKRLNQESWSSLGRSIVTWLLTNILYKRSSGIEPGHTCTQNLNWNASQPPFYSSFKANNKNQNSLTQTVQGQLGVAFLH